MVTAVQRDKAGGGLGKLVQSAALPYRILPDGSVEVLLITTRRTGRWNIPKGNVAAGFSLPASAAKEAFEEAGIRGRISENAAAIYRTIKRLKDRQLILDVVVYLLLVDAEEESWPEIGQRQKRWVSAAEAATLLQEPSLSNLCLSLAASHSVERQQS